MPKIDVSSVSEKFGTYYPKQFNQPCTERVRQCLGDKGGITDYGVKLMRLPP
jgi:uncharacterized cupin superfamily protein